MKVQDVMQSDVRTCGPDTNLAEAVAMLWEQDCGALPVVANGKVEGIVTDRDICIALGTRDRVPHELTVRDVETEQVATCRASDDLGRTLEKMKEAKVRRMPVIAADGHLEGMLSLNDIVLRAGRTSRNGLSLEQVMSTFQAICEHRTPAAQLH